MICEPCLRMSTLVPGSVRSTTTRPSPSAPRRKSIPRRLRGPAAADAEAAGAAAGVAAGRKLAASALDPSATVITLPSTLTAWVTARLRLSTTRERPCACTTLTERRSPCCNSTRLRPRLLLVCARSIAIRAGFATEKLGGTAAAASLSWILTTVPAPVWIASIRSMLFTASTGAAALCAATGAGDQAAKPAAPASTAAATNLYAAFLIACSSAANSPPVPATQGARGVPPSRRRRPARFPSTALRSPKCP